MAVLMFVSAAIRHRQGDICFWAHREFRLRQSLVKDLLIDIICCCCSTESSRVYCRRQILCLHTYELYIPRTPTNFASTCTNTLLDRQTRDTAAASIPILLPCANLLTSTLSQINCRQHRDLTRQHGRIRLGTGTYLGIFDTIESQVLRTLPFDPYWEGFDLRAECRTPVQRRRLRLGPCVGRSHVLAAQ